jgi:hypothetical protein
MHTARNYRQLQRYRRSTHFAFHRYALGISVFTSRILATDLQQSHCHFCSHMQSSCHSLIPSLPFHLSHLKTSNLLSTRWNELPQLVTTDSQFRRLDSVQFLCSQSHIPAGWRLETQPFKSDCCSISLSLSLMLRPTASRPVYLGIKHPSGAYDQIFICLWQLRPCFCGRPLWREDRSDFCICCWHSPA